MAEMIDNEAWLAGYAAYERGEGIPWDDESGRQGWLTAKADGGAYENQGIA